MTDPVAGSHRYINSLRLLLFNLSGGYCTSTIEPCTCPENYSGETCGNALAASDTPSVSAVNKTVPTTSNTVGTGNPAPGRTEGVVEDADDDDSNTASFMQALVNRPGN